MGATAGREPRRKRAAPAAGDREIEAKYAVPDAGTFEKLMALETLGGYRLVPRAALDITDRYFDTANRDLLGAGYACRRRMTNGGAVEVVGLKSLGGAHGAVHRRIEEEWEMPSGSSPESWPAGPILDLLRRVTRGSPLVELLALRQRRAERDVIGGDRKVAVLSLDRVEFAGGTGDPSLELEIELKPGGSEADLLALEPLLRPFGLAPQKHSKFRRALALLDAGGSRAKARPGGRGAAAGDAKDDAAPRPPGEKKRGSKRTGVLATDLMGEAGRKILRFHRDQMLAHEDGTIAGTDPEELHDMRVATRRQRAALRIVEPHFRKKTLRPVRDGLRALAGALGAVRDLDVLSAAAAAYQAKLPAPEARAFQGLLDSWARMRGAARARMLEHLRGRAYAEFKQQYARFLDAPAVESAHGAGETPRPALVAHVLPEEIWSHYADVCAFGPVLPSASVETLHALRVKGKRLRYLLEFFREVLDRRVEKAIETIVGIQDHLGELQDAVVSIRLAGSFLAGPGAASPEAVAATGRYIASRRARIEALRRSLGRRWRVISGRGFKAGLARAAASL